MGRSCFLVFLLISGVLVLSFVHGSERKVLKTSVKYEEKSSSAAAVSVEGSAGKPMRTMIDLMDYPPAQANNRSPPAPPPPPPPPPPFHPPAA
ncbi:uncharacterized protein LOC131143781 [Malania oleifera]|uniref:uncharacterized protein LOC131143781 n=1 Tax=Malania oleifera TaxID=397392 RepID=UPI0025AE3647|nr:uncharacterized protein LOC131143781 [Malania oleifera]